ncbi:hypothetical protein [Candidatus Poriferisocius sp.]|uniref:hypothetical protein n=1 Tax=Candidatus Poriferisocius sp. TaxID=3101276 RepID=UPI003B02A815
MTDQSTEARRSKWLRRPPVWVVVLMVFLLLVVLLIGLYVGGHYLNEKKMDRQREAIVTFVVPTGWEDVPHPGGNVDGGPFTSSPWPCLYPAVFCDWHHKLTWETDGLQSASALRAAAEASGWTEIDFSAEPATSRYSDACQTDGEGFYWCSLRAVSDGVSLELTVWDSSSGGRRWLASLETR